MAGGKETPRQKMISMMYIVLTALMAMNVSSSVLEKFAILSNSLEKSNSSKISETDSIVEHIVSSVKEMGNRATDLVVVEQTESLRQGTKKVLELIESLKSELIRRTGGLDPASGYPKNLKNDVEVANLMINEKKGEELKVILNDYVDFINKLTGEQYGYMALDADESPLFKNDPNQKGKSFSDLNFDHTPLGAALATLNLFENDVLNLEYNAASKLAKSVGADDIKFDKLNVVIRPKSSYVAAGTKYEAEMFLSASSSGVNPEMYISGKQVNVTDGVGQIVFPVSAQSYDKDGVAKQTFKATIKIKSNGKESLAEGNFDYYVVRPVVQVQSASVQALYMNCGNELNIQVPALGMFYSPKFTAVGAQIITSDKKGIITVIPNAKEVKIAVSNDGSTIDTLLYNVRAIPKPEVKVTAGGVAINEKEGLAAPGPRSIEVQIIPDEGFKSFLPKDARYKIVEWEVTLARGSKAVSSKIIKDANRANIAEFMGVARSGDRLIIELKKVVRINFNDVDEIVALPNNLKTIVLT